jgi:hypothetical protein
MIQLYAEGQDAGGLDRGRPWGVVVQHGDQLTAYGFVPVTDAQWLADELYEYVESTSEVSPGVYQVRGTEPGKQLYAKESNGWLFVSDCPEGLANVPLDPTQQLDGIHKQYDVGLRLQLNHVPAKAGKKILAELDKTVGSALRQMTSDKTVNILGEVAFALDEVTLGWSVR